MSEFGPNPWTAVPDQLNNLIGSRLIKTSKIHHVIDGRVMWLCYVVVQTLAGVMADTFFVDATGDRHVGCDSHRDLHQCGPV